MDRGLEFLFDGTIKTISGFDGVIDNGPFGWGVTNNTKSNSYSKVQSKINPGRYINYRGQQFNSNTFAPYEVEMNGLGESAIHSDQSYLDTSELIKWSKRYPSLTLYAKDFVWCKDLGKYPNNRLIVLRRFAGAVGNNLFLPGGGVEPIATVLSWIPPEDDLFKISFGENWKDVSQDIFDIIKSAMGNINIPGLSGGGLGATAANGFAKTMIVDVLKSMGITNLDAADFYGNPNIIGTTMSRDTESKSGFSTDITLEIICKYEMRHIVTSSGAQIDSQVAFLDVIGNIIRMASQDSIFRLSIGFSQNATYIFNAMAEGRTTDVLLQILEGAKSAATRLISDLVNKMVGNAKKEESANSKNEDKDKKESGATNFSLKKTINVSKEVISTVINKTIEGIFAEHRVKLLAAIAAASGLPNAPWHVTIGNPKKPIISIGDMVVTNVELIGKNKLGYDDWPSEIEAKFTVKNARALGAQELESIFNAAQQRIYYRKIEENKTTEGAVNRYVIHEENLESTSAVKKGNNPTEQTKINTATGQVNQPTQDTATNKNPDGSDKK